MSNHAAVAIALATAVSALAVTLLIRATLPWLRRHAVDVPNLRSSHSAPIPRGAGVGVVLGIVVGVCVALVGAGESFAFVVVSTGVCVLAITALGFLDDVRSLAARTRLIAQLVLAAVAATTFASNFDIGVLTAICIAGFITVFVNAFNFMDGVNGISGLVSAVIAAWLAVSGWMWDADLTLVVASVAVSAGSLGFLPWNMFQAVAFLGDSGSYGLGFALSALGVWAWLDGVPFVVAIAPFLIYVADVLMAITAKTRRGLSWDAPHRMHVYQQLSDAGWSHPLVAWVVATCVVLTGLMSLVMTHLAVVGGVMLASTVLGYLGLPHLANRLARQPA